MREAPNTAELDEHLQEIVQALHGAVRQAMSRLDDPRRADQAIQDCNEILSVVLAGKTAEWLNQTGD